MAVVLRNAKVYGLRTLSTSSLIRPSNTIRVTIFEKMFQPEKFSKTECFPTKWNVTPLLGNFGGILYFFTEPSFPVNLPSLFICMDFSLFAPEGLQ